MGRESGNRKFGDEGRCATIGYEALLAADDFSQTLKVWDITHSKNHE